MESHAGGLGIGADCARGYDDFAGQYARLWPRPGAGVSQDACARALSVGLGGGPLPEDNWDHELRPNEDFND